MGDETVNDLSDDARSVRQWTPGAIEDPSVHRELRLAVTMNGGVSLAVYIGGVAHELDQLTRQGSNYSALLKMLGYQPPPVVDVITGTSAGGINAAALALAQANELGDLELLKNLWIQHGQIGELLRGPFSSGPPSLMKGDDYFYPQILSAFRELTKNYRRSTREPLGQETSGNDVRPIDLTITATLLTPAQTFRVDDLGTAMVQPEHAGLFRFRGGIRRSPDDTGPDDMFGGTDDSGEIRETVKALALAARATTGFPLAFEPTFVPVHCQNDCPGDRPDMHHFANWADTPKPGETARDMSRFAVDGGVLANTPTKPALTAIRRQEVSSNLTRRVLVLVHPHATYASEVQDLPDSNSSPPTLLGGLTGVLRASSSVGSKTYVEEIQNHNDAALRSRDGRLATLEQFGPTNSIAAFLTVGNEAQPAWALLRAMRVRRASYVLARQIRAGFKTPFSKLIEYASDELTAWEGEGGLPFLPKSPPTAKEFQMEEWRWGLDLAVGVTALVTDLLRAVVSRPDAIPPALRAAVESEARIAWRVAVNHGVKLAVLGENEERRACDIARGGTTETDLSGAPTESNVIRDRLQRIVDSYHEHMCPTLIAAQSNPADDATPQGSANSEQSDGAKVSAVMLNVSSALLKVIALLDEPRGPEDLANTEDGSPTASILDRTNPLRGAPDAYELLKRMVEVELVAYLLADHSVTEDEVPTTPIELVQLSAQVKQDFAAGLNSDDKLAGMSLNRFGAFLKRSWRANDWIWGRLDAIKILMLILLTPQIVRGLSRPAGHTVPLTAEQTVDRIVAAAFDKYGGARALAQLSSLTNLKRDAVGEVQRTLDGSDAPLTDLASLAAYGVQIGAANKEVPWLAQTIRDDREDGATGAESASFLHRFDAIHTSQKLTQSTGYELLQLFAESRIGQEAPSQQMPSDLMIRTAAAAAASAVTAISSDRSGLGMARPLTKAARAAIAVPYWTLTGLTHRGQLARAIATTVLALGVSLVALSLLAPLPGILAAILPTIGVASLATILVYAALRTQSMVHGAALLGLFIPLVAFGVYRMTAPKFETTEVAATDRNVKHAAESILQSEGAALVIITVGFLLLWVVLVANMKAHNRSPMGVILLGWDRLQRLVKVDIPEFVSKRKWHIAVVAVLAAALVALGWHFRAKIPSTLAFIDHELETGPWSGRIISWATAVLIAIAVLSGVIALYKSRRFMPASQPEVFKRRILTDPAGLATAWAPVYGALYILIGIVMIPLVGDDAPTWAVVAALTSVVAGLGFSLIAVHRIPQLRERKLVRRVATYLATNPEPANCLEWVAVFAKIGDSPAYLFVRSHPAKDPAEPNRACPLSRHGWRVVYRAQRLDRARKGKRPMLTQAVNPPSHGNHEEPLQEQPVGARTPMLAGQS
jgi:patatin-related protein